MRTAFFIARLTRIEIPADFAGRAEACPVKNVLLNWVEMLLCEISLKVNREIRYASEQIRRHPSKYNSRQIENSKIKGRALGRRTGTLALHRRVQSPDVKSAADLSD